MLRLRGWRVMRTGVAYRRCFVSDMLQQYIVSDTTSTAGALINARCEPGQGGRAPEQLRQVQSVESSEPVRKRQTQPGQPSRVEPERSSLQPARSRCTATWITRLVKLAPTRTMSFRAISPMDFLSVLVFQHRRWKVGSPLVFDRVAGNSCIPEDESRQSRLWTKGNIPRWRTFWLRKRKRPRKPTNFAKVSGQTGESFPASKRNR